MGGYVHVLPVLLVVVRVAPVDIGVVAAGALGVRTHNAAGRFCGGVRDY